MSFVDEVGMSDDRPSVPVEEGAEELAEKCADDRSELTPHETGDCAGMDLVREFDNEEDGGS